MRVESFEISVPKETLEDLRQRLAMTRWPDEVDGAGWDYGTNLGSIFPKDIVPAPHDFGERIFNIHRWTEMPRGGHFAALEEPELLAEDLWEFFRDYR